MKPATEVAGSTTVEVGDGQAGFELFDLTVSVGPEKTLWVSAASRMGHVHGIPRLDPTLPSLDDLLDLVWDFVDAVRFAERQPDPELSQALGRIVFEEPVVLELFQATRGAAADRERQVLVRIMASPHLAALPWELLPDPVYRVPASETSRGASARAIDTGRRYLTLAPDAHVVRLARGRTYPVEKRRIDAPLNLLVVLSSPSGREKEDESLSFDIYEEKRNLLAELQPLVDRGLLGVEVEDHPTLENLRKRIGAERRGFHLFHYLGHAEPGGLILEDDEGRRDDQSGARFTEILRLCPELRLAVFAGCQTARPPGDPLTLDVGKAVGWRHLLSLADRCVQESSPLVVGMQAVLPFRTERIFTRFFYQGLASGHSVAVALRLARGAIRGDRHVGGDLLDWSVPALFAGGSAPGPLLDRSAAGKPPGRSERRVLRLGLRQRETRFFARDVALRQAIDVLSGGTPERVLMITGPPSVGKTMLLDRALEELSPTTSQLYVNLDELLPELKPTLDAARADDACRPRTWSLEMLDAHRPLERLCALVAELLTREGANAHRRDPKWTAPEWWQRLVEDLTERRFVLAVDSYELIDDVEKALLRRILPCWVTPLVREALRSDAPGARRAVCDLFYELLDACRDLKPDIDKERSGQNPLVAALPELARMAGADSRDPVRPSGLACEVLAEWTESTLDQLLDTPAGIPGTAPKLPAEPAESERDAVLKDLERLVSVRGELERAFRQLAGRRSASRLVIASGEQPDTLLAQVSENCFVMRLGHLTWPETLRWIRRNLPGLVRYGEDYLAQAWPRLGPHLERWEELERQVLLAGRTEAQIKRTLDEIAPRRPAARLAARRRGQRPLRVAVAGKKLAGPEHFAAAVTRLAADNAFGGRVVTGGTDEAGVLAVMVEEPSPFHDTDMATDSEILGWIKRVARQRPDIILLDYGAPHGVPAQEIQSPEHRFLRALHYRTLLVAAGGHGDSGDKRAVLWTPAAFAEVLAVGPARADGRLQEYALWTPAVRKPDIFMADQLIGTALEEALVEGMSGSNSPFGPGTHGSSFAALYAVATAILVWLTLPDLSPDGVRRVLESAARPLNGYGRPKPRLLDLPDALSYARRLVVTRTLARGPCSLQALAAITGLEPRVASSIVEGLVPETVRHLRGGRLERYELVQSPS